MRKEGKMPRKLRARFEGSGASKFGIFSFIVLFFRELELPKRFQKVLFKLGRNAVFKICVCCFLPSSFSGYNEFTTSSLNFQQSYE